MGDGFRKRSEEIPADEGLGYCVSRTTILIPTRSLELSVTLNNPRFEYHHHHPRMCRSHRRQSQESPDHPDPASPSSPPPSSTPPESDMFPDLWNIITDRASVFTRSLVGLPMLYRHTSSN